ncbi:MAG: hypothetical protein ACKVPJ_12550 [Chitinophagales bacterium]
MKNKIVFLLLSYIVVSASFTQTFNWAALSEENKNSVYVDAGLEFGMIARAGYSHSLNLFFPVIAHVDVTVPSGEYLFDDLKTEIGGNIRLVSYNNFQFSGKVNGVFRKYDGSFVRITNFGCDASGIIGYYRPKWFAAGEFGFDKAIVSHFKHTDAYLGNYADAVDGWYEPDAGGNYYYGLQAGLNFKQSAITMNTGMIKTEKFVSTPLLPFYFSLGYGFSF